MINCSKAVNYFKEKQRMCKQNQLCNSCPLYAKGPCGRFETRHPKMAIEIVQKWSNEHPVKTRLDAFMQMFPNCEIDDDGNPMVCVRAFDENIKCPNNQSCENCLKDYWLAPAEGEEQQ